MPKNKVNNNIKLKSGGGILNGVDGLEADSGTTADKLVKLDGDGKLPAVDGSQLTNLPALPAFQSIPYYAGTDTGKPNLRITSNSTGTVIYTAEIGSGSLITHRYEKLSTGQYQMTHTGSVPYGPIKYSMCVIGNYLYIPIYDNSVHERVYRYNAANLTGGQLMTISGTAFGSSGGDASFGDGLNIYIYKSDSVFSKYYFSGTTITFIADITYTGAGRVDNGGAISNGSNVWMAATTDTSIVLKKYNFTGGAVIATATTYYIPKSFPEQGVARLFLGSTTSIGVAYGYTSYTGANRSGAIMNLNFFPIV